MPSNKHGMLGAGAERLSSASMSLEGKEHAKIFVVKSRLASL